MVWFQSGRFFSSLNFSVPFFIGFFLFYSRCPTFPFTLHPPLSRVVAAPHGTPTAISWVNVGHCVSLDSSGRSATVVLSWDRVLALWGMSICSVYVSGRCIPLADICLWSAHICRGLIISVLPYHLAEVTHAGVGVMACLCWCSYLLNT